MKLERLLVLVLFRVTGVVIAMQMLVSSYFL